MFEALQYYQSLAQKFQPQLLTGPGIAIVLLGLSIWLAGLRWKRLLAAVAGGIIAAVIAVSISEQGIIILSSIAAGGAVIGAAANKFALGLFVSALAAVFTMAFVCGVFTDKQAEQPDTEALTMVEVFDSADYDANSITADDFVSSHSGYPTWPQYQQQDIVIPSPDAIKITAAMARYLLGQAKSAIASAGSAEYAAAAIAAVIVAAFAMLTNRLFIATACSIFGVAIIFAGMLMVLFYKNSEPLNYLASRKQFYILVCAVMVIFGVIVQLILSPERATPIDVKPKKENGE